MHGGGWVTGRRATGGSQTADIRASPVRRVWSTVSSVFQNLEVVELQSAAAVAASASLATGAAAARPARTAASPDAGARSARGAHRPRPRDAALRTRSGPATSPSAPDDPAIVRRRVAAATWKLDVKPLLPAARVGAEVLRSAGLGASPQTQPLLLWRCLRP